MSNHKRKINLKKILNYNLCFKHGGFGIFFHWCLSRNRYGVRVARWHIRMSSASHPEDPGSNPGKGENY